MKQMNILLSPAWDLAQEGPVFFWDSDIMVLMTITITELGIREWKRLTRVQAALIPIGGLLKNLGSSWE